MVVGVGMGVVVLEQSKTAKLTISKVWIYTCKLKKIPFKIDEVLNSPENVGTQLVVLACEVLKVETPQENLNIYEVII